MFLDIAAGVCLGGLLLWGMLWGAFVGRRRPSERPFFWICFFLSLLLIAWRVTAWVEIDKQHQQSASITD
jgi:hypothetical protein